MPSDMPAATVRKNRTLMPSRRSIVFIISAVFATALTALFLVPWSPDMPVAGLESWRSAVNEAVARHLVFGRDLIWTYGPLGAVATGVYHPDTDALMLIGSLLLTIALSVGFAMLVWPRRIYLLPLLPIVVASIWGYEVVIMVLPFLLLLIVFRLSVPPESHRYVRPRGTSLLCVAVLSCAVGILSLIKGPMLALAAVEGGLAILMALVARQRALALVILFFAISSLYVGWLAAQQPLAALPRFFWAQEEIAVGYSQAMSLHGPFPQLLFLGIPAIFLTAMFYICITRKEKLAGWLVFVGFAFYLFVSFKEGFVRQDAHVNFAGDAFLLVALFLGALLEPLPAIALAIVACLGWVAIESSVGNFGAATIVARIENRARNAVNGIILRVSSPDRLLAEFGQANAAIRAASPFPRVRGTVDLYPTNLSLLFADGMKWNGRPIMQSYSAYTPALAEANAAHLRGNDAPENIFFGVEATDGRLPALEDGVSWPLLLNNYSIVGFRGNYLQMLRAARPTPMLFDRPTAAATARVGEWVNVPWSGELVWARIEMRPTIAGRLVLATFKLPRVSIELKLADGRTVRHRYIPEMGRAGFLLSPYVGSTVDFVMAASGEDSGQYVRQLRLETPAVGLWERHISLSFTVLGISRQRDAGK